MNFTPLEDTHGRVIRYLRLSVTDRCNLRCIYCASEEGFKFTQHSAILSYEELEQIVHVAVQAGIKKIRLTGGEPFARKGFIDFLKQLRDSYPELILTLTSNGTLIRSHLKTLKELNLNGLNISLDSFNSARFAKITGQDMLPEVLGCIDEAMALALPLKINAVAMRGVNDMDLPDFINFATTYPVDVRFVEYMPMGGKGTWTTESFWPAEEIVRQAEKYAKLTPFTSEDHWRECSGPARLYSIENGLGRFGVITPVSQHFCSSCNRFRVTADGNLRACLFSDESYDLKAVLRAIGVENAGAARVTQNAALYEIFMKANSSKLLGTDLLRNRVRMDSVIARSMSSIGG